MPLLEGDNEGIRFSSVRLEASMDGLNGSSSRKYACTYVVPCTEGVISSGHSSGMGSSGDVEKGRQGRGLTTNGGVDPRRRLRLSFQHFLGLGLFVWRRRRKVVFVFGFHYLHRFFEVDGRSSDRSLELRLARAVLRLQASRASLDKAKGFREGGGAGRVRDACRTR